MKLTTFERPIDAKNSVKRIRRQGNIPVVTYEKGQKGKIIFVDGHQFLKILSHLKMGELATTIFELEGDGIKARAIVKDIQYNVVTYDVIHIDFLLLHDDTKININVPIECTGAMNCVGAKLGGVIRQVLRTLKVQCLPKNLPVSFELDVAPLNIGHSLRLSDIAMPKDVKPMEDLKKVAVTIAKR